LIFDGGDSFVQTEGPFKVVKTTVDFLESALRFFAQTIYSFAQTIYPFPQRAHLWRHQILEELANIFNHTHGGIIAALFATLTRIEGLDPWLPTNPARNILKPSLV